MQWFGKSIQAEVSGLELEPKAANKILVPYRAPEQWHELVRIATLQMRNASALVSVDSFCERMIDE